MTVRVQSSIALAAPPARVWAELSDWEGQDRWIPASTVLVRGERRTGVGVRVCATNGIVLAGCRRGLVDNFVVTGWTEDDGVGQIEVLHLGPVFTGVGVFSVRADGPGRSRFAIVEDFTLSQPVLGPLLELGARLVRPVLEAGIAYSLRRFAAVLRA